MAIVAFDWTMNEAQPLLATCGLELTSVVPCAVPPVLEVNARLMVSVAPVTVLLAASLTQTAMVDWETPLAGIGFGEALAARCVAGPAPVNEIVVAAGVSPLDVAVAVHTSATASLIVNRTVVPLADVPEVAGLPVTPAGVVLVAVAPQMVEVFGWFICRVTAVGPKTLLPPASWTWTVTSHVELDDVTVVGVLLHVLLVITSLAGGPDPVTVAVAEPDCRPGAVAVMVQLPGEPVVVSVELAVLAPAGTIALVGETLQTPLLSTLKLTDWALCVFAATPLASFNVAVTVVVRGLPAGNSLRPSETPMDVGAPAVVNVTFVMQPGSRTVEAES